MEQTQGPFVQQRPLRGRLCHRPHPSTELPGTTGPAASRCWRSGRTGPPTGRPGPHLAPSSVRGPGSLRPFLLATRASPGEASAGLSCPATLLPFVPQPADPAGPWRVVSDLQASPGFSWGTRYLSARVCPAPGALMSLRLQRRSFQTKPRPLGGPGGQGVNLSVLGDTVQAVTRVMSRSGGPVARREQGDGPQGFNYKAKLSFLTEMHLFPYSL